VVCEKAIPVEKRNNRARMLFFMRLVLVEDDINLCLLIFTCSVDFDGGNTIRPNFNCIQNYPEF
jgi:hypothetical protein